LEEFAIDIFLQHDNGALHPRRAQCQKHTLFGAAVSVGLTI